VKGVGVSPETDPRILIVYFSLTQQSSRVAEAMSRALAARGCDVTMAAIEFTDEKYANTLAQFPMKRPALQIASILPAQLRRKTGQIRIPPEAEEGDYDLIVFSSPTWWLTTNMPIRSYLSSRAARTVMSGKPFASASVSRRYYKGNLKGIRKLGEANGGSLVGETHFVVAGGQVKSMLSWLGYMKHGEPQPRVCGMTMPPPNLPPGFEDQARGFADHIVDEVFDRPVSGERGAPDEADADRAT
jgi:flavodoxin